MGQNLHREKFPDVDIYCYVLHHLYADNVYVEHTKVLEFHDKIHPQGENTQQSVVDKKYSRLTML